MRAPVVIAIVAGGIVVLRIAMRAAGYGTLGGKTIVRCRQGHLFTTVWHWTFVRPVRENDLTPAQRRQAEAVRDIRIP